MVEYSARSKQFIKRNFLTLISIFKEDLEEIKNKVLDAEDPIPLRAQAKYLKDWIAHLEMMKVETKENKDSSLNDSII